MARCPTYQDFQDANEDERYGFQPNPKNPANRYKKSFHQICIETPDPVFGNHARRLDVIDRIVNNSREGSLTDADARQQAEFLFSMRAEMTHSKFYAAQQILDVSFQNNLSNGVANSFYDEWTRDERRYG